MKNDSLVQMIHPLKATDLLPGFLSLLRRIPAIAWNMKTYLGFEDDTPLSMGTILEENARKYPNNIAIYYEDIQLTHKEFNAAVNTYAHYFISQGMKKGDRAIVMVDNRPELLMLIGAISKIGGISSLINPNQRGDVLLHSINLTRGNIFIVGEELLEAFEGVKASIKLKPEDLLVFVPEDSRIPTPEGYENLYDKTRNLQEDNPSTVKEIQLNDPFAYVFTSGTTGMPKASIQTHRRWVGGIYWFGRIVMNLKPDDIHYCALPFCHTNALNVSWGACSSKGTAMAIRRKFSVRHFWEDVRKYNANSFIYIGELCRYLMNQPVSPDDQNNRIEKIVGNGLRPEIWKQFKTRFGIDKVYELYGAAEGPLIFTNLFNVDCTVGCCLTPFAIVKYDTDEDMPIRDEKGFMQKVDPGEIGLLVSEIKEGLPFYGYTDERENEKKIFRDVFEKGDTWFHSGDLLRNMGYKHAQFVDRLGDTFRWKGENVSTVEVEKIVNTHFQVSQSCAYGVHIPGTDGRAGMVSIIPVSGAEDFNLQLLADTVRKTLPSYAVPKFIRFKDRFETTGTHKIKKNDLRDEGFDLNKVKDPLFAMLPGNNTYEPLTIELHRDICEGKYRF